MILVSENTTARDGAVVQSVVKLNIEDIGVEDLYHSFTRTEAEAKVRRDRMHAAYIDVHRAA